MSQLARFPFFLNWFADIRSQMPAGRRRVMHLLPESAEECRWFQPNLMTLARLEDWNREMMEKSHGNGGNGSCLEATASQLDRNGDGIPDLIIDKIRELEEDPNK